MTSSLLAQWLKWQAPYAAFCYAYFPVTFTKRMLLQSKRAYVGLDPFTRRFWDKWGMLSPELTSKSRERPVWINMSSGGEVLMGWGLLEKLRVGEGPYVLSTESYDSYELLCRAFGRDRTFFPPWDLNVPARRDLGGIRPRALVFVTNACFPILLRHARRAGIKTILVNGLLSRNWEVSSRLMQRGLALGFYRELDAISVQSEEDYAAFRRLGVPKDRLAVTGNLASDLSQLRLTLMQRDALRRSLKFTERDRIMIVGSTHPGELEVLVEVFEGVRRHVPGVRFILAPRWIHEAKGMMKWLRRRGFRVVLRTQLPTDNNDGQPDVLVLDTFGELATLYGVADVAFIGSSLVPINGRGNGHNPLEPLAHGVVPLFGPYMNLWRQVTHRLLQVDPGLEVESAKALAHRAVDILEGKVPTVAIRQVGETIIAQQRGSLERTVRFTKDSIGI